MSGRLPPGAPDRDRPLRRTLRHALRAGLAAALLLPLPVTAGGCDSWRGIWARDEDEGRWIVYTSDRPISDGWNTFFELRRGDRRLARPARQRYLLERDLHLRPADRRPRSGRSRRRRQRRPVPVRRHSLCQHPHRGP